MYADRVKDSTTSPGLGAVTLANTSSTGYQTFATAFGASPVTVAYCIADQSGPNWEVGTGTFNGTTGLTRTTVLASSNAGSLVNFSAGTQDVFCTAPAKYLDTFTSTDQGTVPASGGGTTNFLRADGTFAAPPVTAPGGSNTQVQYNNAGAFAGSASFTWSPTTFTVGPAGGTVTVQTVAPTSSQTAALLRFLGRNAVQANSTGGGFAFNGGTGTGTAQGGGYLVSTGQCTNGQGGNITFATGGSTNNLGGLMTFTAGQGGVLGGGLTFNAGNGIGVNGTGGAFTMLSGDGRGSGQGGDYLLTAGNNTDLIGPGGSLYILPGYGGTTGSIVLQTPAGGNGIEVTDNGSAAKVGFFGATPVVKPTGVAITAAGIHAALVSLGLIS